MEKEVPGTGGHHIIATHGPDPEVEDFLKKLKKKHQPQLVDIHEIRFWDIIVNSDNSKILEDLGNQPHGKIEIPKLFLKCVNIGSHHRIESLELKGTPGRGGGIPIFPPQEDSQLGTNDTEIISIVKIKDILGL